MGVDDAIVKFIAILTTTIMAVSVGLLAVVGSFVGLSLLYLWLPEATTTIVIVVVAYGVGTNLDNLVPKNVDQNWMKIFKFTLWTFAIVTSIIMLFEVVHQIINALFWLFGLLLSSLNRFVSSFIWSIPFIVLVFVIGVGLPKN
jgi:hypothetical protein